MTTFRVTFLAQGSITQNITMLHKGISASDLQSGLNSGKYITTIQEGGTFIQEESSGARIAKIDEINNFLDYLDFEVEVN